MNKKLKKLCKYAVLSLLVFSIVIGCSSCAKANKLLTRSIVSAIGIDADQDGYVVTVQTFNTASETQKFYNFTSHAKDIHQALQNTEMLSGKENYYPQLLVVIIGKSALDYNLVDILENMVRNPEIQSAVPIVATEGSAYEILASDFEPLKTLVELGNYSQMYNSHNSLEKSTILNVYNRLSDDMCDVFLPIVNFYPPETVHRFDADSLEPTENNSTDGSSSLQQSSSQSSSSEGTANSSSTSKEVSSSSEQSSESSQQSSSKASSPEGTSASSSKASSGSSPSEDILGSGVGSASSQAAPSDQSGVSQEGSTGQGGEEQQKNDSENMDSVGKASLLALEGAFYFKDGQKVNKIDKDQLDTLGWFIENEDQNVLLVDNDKYGLLTFQNEAKKMDIQTSFKGDEVTFNINLNNKFTLVSVDKMISEKFSEQEIIDMETDLSRQVKKDIEKLLQQVYYKGKVDIFDLFRTLRYQYPDFVDTMESVNYDYYIPNSKVNVNVSSEIVREGIEFS